MIPENDSELVESIKSAIGMSGLLFQSHPDHPEWDTTRPGARTGEVAAFVRDVEGEQKSYISVCRWYEGEEDIDNEYVYEQDTWEIIVSDPVFQEYHTATSAEQAAEIVASEMRNISGE